MSSRMEQMIDEIEGYVESCKYATFSSTKIIVDKEELGELLNELRSKTPEEIKRYQKVISNKEAILADAQAKADQIIQGAQVEKSELVSEHQIMQQAYQQANEVVELASQQAQQTLDVAIGEANDLRSGAVNYTDEQLGSIEEILTNTINTTKDFYSNVINTLEGYLATVRSNRDELAPMMGKSNKAKTGSRTTPPAAQRSSSPKPLAAETAESAGFSEVDVSDSENESDE